jgi:nucleoside-diphosphate-sugar epimerase
LNTPEKTKISIIGCGWLGFPLAAALIKKGYKVLGTTTQAEKRPQLSAAGIEAYLLDLSNNANFSEDLAAVWQADIFIISIPPRGGENYLQQISTLLGQILAPNKKPWVIFTSSTGVYGKAEGLINEDAPCKPDRPSTVAIFAVEQMLLSLQTQIDVSILRFSGLIGASRQAGRFFAGKQNLSSGSTPVNLIHLDDCVAILTSLIQKNLRPTLLNVCADKHPLHRDFYPKQALRLGLEPPTYGDNAPDAEQKIIDNSRLKKLLAYSFLHPDPMDFPII